MFTGIIETTGIVRRVTKNGSGKTLVIESNISQDLKIDQSVSHNGVCLTIEAISDNTYTVTAIEETLKKTNLNGLKENDIINLERCMIMNGRIDGHIVQGHVDTTAKCIFIDNKNGSHEFEFSFDEKFAAFIIEKGSICVNGISLTVFDAGFNNFKVAIIPYTYEHTNIQYLKAGDTVNIEFDVIGKYILRSRELDQC